MASRTLQGPDGTRWEVWDVQPGQQLGSSDRHSRLLPPEMAAGWLCFDSPEEKRRLYPIPNDWDRTDEAELLRMCRDARPVRPDRLPSF